MQLNMLEDPPAKAAWSVTHPLSEEDLAAVAGLRSVVAPMKGKIEGTAGHAAGQALSASRAFLSERLGRKTG
jgi:hypothetical protein